MLSRGKLNMTLIECGDLPFESWLRADELVGSASGSLLLRRVTFLDVPSTVIPKRSAASAVGPGEGAT